MKVLFFGDMAATGFGTVTMDLGKALLDKGLDVRFYSQNEVESLPEPFDARTIDTASLVIAQRQALTDQNFPEVAAVAENIPKVITGEATDVYAMSGDAWGEWRPDACVLLGDFAAARLMFVRFRDQFRQVPTYHYVPIEGVDLPPSWKDVWDIMRPIAISEFGADQIEAVMGARPPVAFHGVDVEAFRPATPSNPYIVKDHDNEGQWHRIDSQDKAKAFFGVDPRVKMVLRTDTHWPRKQQNAGIRSLAPMLLTRRDTIYALHVGPIGPGGNLLDTMSKFPGLEKFVQFTGLGKVPRDILALLYNAADVYVSFSAEGFGLTIAEAIACGTPAVGLRFSAVPEVIGPAGMVVEPKGLMENEYDHFWAYPDEDKHREPVAWLLDHPKRARELGALGPRHVREHFTWAKAADVFLEVLGADGTKSAD